MFCRKKGFTLVELSIVLVIIGLLIGGILVAQSMVATANIEATVKQFQQYDAAVETFKTRYNYLPGDAKVYTPGADNDGLLSLGSCCGYSTSVFGGEIANFWSSLFPDNFVGCNFAAGCWGVGQQVYTSGAFANAPLSKIGKKGSFILAAARDVTFLSPIAPGSDAEDTSNPQNYYFVLDPTQVQGPTGGGYYGPAPTTVNGSNAAINSALKPSELLALDQKMDDGFASSGNIIAGRMTFCGGSNTACMYTSPLPHCASGANYNVQYNTYECTPFIRVGSQTGDPQ